MNKPIVFMFSGQGSQYYQMGRELYENNKRFAQWMNYCDELVSPMIGESLINVLYDKNADKGEPFDRLLHTNPALLCIEYCLARVLMEMDIKPDYLLGYSLGEFTACVIAEVLSLESAIELVTDFATVLERDTDPGGMLAIVASEKLMARYPATFDGCWLAGRNFENNFVVSGLAKDIRRLQMELNNSHIVTQKLSVNYAFHTCLMDKVKSAFYEIAGRVNYRPATIPIVSPLSGSLINTIDENYLWNVIRQPVEFESTVKTLLNQYNYIYMDVGPSGTLATFVKYLFTEPTNSQSVEVMNPFGRDQKTLEKLIGAVAHRSESLLQA